MHYTGVEVDGTTYHINHNSDWSGEAIITWRPPHEPAQMPEPYPEQQEVRLPGKALLKLGFEAAKRYITGELISKLEDL